MNDVEELKRYVAVHAEGLDLKGYESLLERIGSDGDGPGSWAGEWSAEGDRLRAGGKHLEASRHYLMGRFPFVDGVARATAYDRCVQEFEAWAEDQDVHRHDLTFEDARVRCWQTGLSAGGDRPLLIVMGGFLTLKEQWAPALPIFARLGMAVIALEMPGVGENTVPYSATSWRYLSAVLDSLTGRADTGRAYLLAMSFSGHQALRCAMDEPRIKGVITAGAPVSAFFTDDAWQKGLPDVTVDTLAHLSGTDLAGLADRALPVAGLAGLKIPVAYVASLRDEIIPPQDLGILRENVSDLRILEHDDVHGSPSHTDESKIWMARELFRMQGVRDHRALLLAAMWHLTRARSSATGLLRRLRGVPAPGTTSRHDEDRP